MKAVILDTESGLVRNSGIAIEKQPRIIEFYGCMVDESGKILKELGFMCNPGEPIEKDVVRITGITDAMVANEKPFRDYIPQLIDLFKDADAVVGHNVFHDVSVVSLELKRENIDEKTFWPKRKICTVEATEYISGYRLSLSKLYEYLFNEGFTGAHRAREDTRATVRIFLELVKREII